MFNPGYASSIFKYREVIRTTVELYYSVILEQYYGDISPPILMALFLQHNCSIQVKSDIQHLFYSTHFDR